jgi:hypothetical protein
VTIVIVFNPLIIAQPSSLKNIYQWLEMINIYLSLLFFIVGECVQPYFPPQLLFFAGPTLYAVDEINQQAYKSVSDSVKSSETAYAMKSFPYAIPDSPQSKYYVQLQDKFPDTGCRYGTYWKYGGNTFNTFPEHWNNGSSFEIRNFINFKYEMIHSNKSFVYEDYWYSNKTCRPLGKTCPCEEIYFRKGTDIPVRSTQVVRTPWDVQQYTTEYLMITVGKPDDKYFDPIIKDWSFTCRDVMLGVLYNPNTSKIDLSKSVKFQVWLPTPPHRMNGTDTVTIQWKAAGCTDCLTWKPTTLSFNSKNFYGQQILTITRVKEGPEATLTPIFNGGGFDLVSPHNYTIVIEHT